MSPLVVLITAGFAPAAIAGAVLLSGRWPRWQRFAPVLATYGAYLLGHILTVGWGTPASDITHAVVWIASGALLWQCAELFVASRLPLPARLAARIVPSLVAGYVLAMPLLAQKAVGVSAVLAVGTAIWIGWVGLERLMAAGIGTAAAILAIAWVGASSAAVFFAGNATTAMLAGPLVAALGMGFLFSFRRSEPGWLAPVASVVGPAVVAQGAVGAFYANGVPTATVLVVVLLPGLVWGLGLLLTRRIPRWALAAQALVSVGALGMAVTLAADRYFAPIAAPASSSGVGAPGAPSSQAVQPDYDPNYGY